MGFTNTTSHYNLPQYVATDKPKYLTDFNQTMEAIDTQMYTNAQAAATADGKAVAAKDTADGAVSSIGTLNTQINGDVSDPSDRGLAGDVSDNSGAINTINSLIGNGTPTTTDKTIIGAINEIYADITGGGTDVTAGNVSYVNTTSGLTATDVQAAIDELAQGSGGTVEADDVSYDNTSSGLAATNVQGAIDEVNGKIAGSTTISVTADGVKTNAQLLNDLFALIGSAVNDPRFINAKLVAGASVMDIASIQPEQVRFGFVYVGASSATLRGAILKASGSSYGDCTLASSGVTMGDASSTVPASGTVYSIVY